MEKSHYEVTVPTVVGFSGGRTSAYMVRRILDAHDGVWPAQAVPIFCNTGKERLETLDFVAEVARRWNVPVVWLEYRYLPPSEDGGKGQHTFAVVDRGTASQAGEPFLDAILHG